MIFTARTAAELKQQIIDAGLPAGSKLPTVRALADELGLAVNTVAKAYRELEREGVVELKQGAGAFVADTGRAKKGGAEKFRGVQPLVAKTVGELRARGLNDDEIRRVFEAELAGFSRAGGQSG